jgi:hypothetical protein
MNQIALNVRGAHDAYLHDANFVYAPERRVAVEAMSPQEIATVYRFEMTPDIYDDEAEEKVRNLREDPQVAAELDEIIDDDAWADVRPGDRIRITQDDIVREGEASRYVNGVWFTPSGHRLGGPEYGGSVEIISRTYQEGAIALLTINDGAAVPAVLTADGWKNMHTGELVVQAGAEYQVTGISIVFDPYLAVTE